MAPSPSRTRKQVVVELPPPPADKWRWESLSPVKVKREEEQDDVVLTGERFTLHKPSDQSNEIKVKLEETAEELKVKEKKVKVEPAALVLPNESVRRRLDRLPHNLFRTSLTEREQNHTISRQLFTDHYEGGHNQFTFFDVRGRALGRDWIRMMCPNGTMNPYSPFIPGTHGLFMDAGIADDPESDDEVDKKPAKSEATAANPEETEEGKRPVTTEKEDKKEVFRPRLVVLAHVAPGHWRYVGHYDMVPSEPLSSAEWQGQSAKFKNKWASVVFREQYCYGLRRGVWHRKRLRAQLKRDPTKEEVRAVIEPLSRPELVGLTPKDIELAFENGELRIDIRALCFVEYHEEFQKDLIKISVHPEPRVKKRRPKKRKRPVSDDDDDDSD